MELKKLQLRSVFNEDKKLTERLDSFGKLINELQKKDMPEEIVNSINQDIDVLNRFSGTNSDFLKLFRKTQTKIVKIIEKELKLVTRNHYQNMWLPLGMSVFGIPIGVAFGLSMGNLGLLGLGLPIGMGIGIVVGTAMDKKAKESGNQLDVAIKY